MFDEYSFSSFPFRKGLNTIKFEIMGPKEIRTIFKSIKMSAKSVAFDCAKYNGKLKNKNTSKEESKMRVKSLVVSNQYFKFQRDTSHFFKIGKCIASNIYIYHHTY